MITCMVMLSLLSSFGVSVAQSNGKSNVDELTQKLKRLQLQSSNPQQYPKNISGPPGVFMQTSLQQNKFQQKTPPPPLQKQKTDFYGN